MLALLLLLLILPTSILYFTQRLRRRPKTLSPPGPTGLPIIGNLHQVDNATPTFTSSNSQKYGPLISINLGSVHAVVVSSPEIAKEVLKTHDLAFCSRPKLVGQHRLSYNGSDVAFAPYSESWRELRKIVVLHLLSNKQVQSFAPAREAEVLRTIGSLSSGEVCNMSAIMLDFTSNLICRIAFGKERGGDGPGRSRFNELMLESQTIQGPFFVTDYLPWFGWVDRLSGVTARLDRVFEDFDEFFRMLIDEHLDPSRPKLRNPDILDLLIQLKVESSCSIDLTWDHVKAILLNIFVAATDTGAVAIIWSMTALMQNPKTMKKLQKEIRELVADRGQVKEDDLPKLPYLLAVVKETLIVPTNTTPIAQGINRQL